MLAIAVLLTLGAQGLAEAPAGTSRMPENPRFSGVDPINDRWVFVPRRRSAISSGPWLSLSGDGRVDLVVVSATCRGKVNANYFGGGITRYSVKGKKMRKPMRVGGNRPALFYAANGDTSWAGEPLLIAGVRGNSGETVYWRIPFGPEDQQVVESYVRSKRCRVERRTPDMGPRYGDHTRPD